MKKIMPFGQAGLSYFCLSLIAGGNNQNVLAKKELLNPARFRIRPVMESNLKLIISMLD